MSYLEKNEKNLADAIKNAVIQELFWHCRERSDADNPNYFPLAFLEYYIDYQPSKEHPGTVYLAGVYISKDNEFEYDFTDLMEG